MSEADIIGTGRYKAIVNPVVAEIAFAGKPLPVIKRNRIIGACGYTALTTGALIHIKHHDAIVPLCYGFIRASIYAGRLIAMAAQIHLKGK